MNSSKLILHQSSNFKVYLANPPILGGHLIVTPTSSVSMFSELKPKDAADLGLLVQKVNHFLRKYFSSQGSTISWQDNQYQAKVHIFPRDPTTDAQQFQNYIETFGVNH